MTNRQESAGARIVPALFYDDPAAALDWLEKAFGFEVSLRVTDKGKIAHAEMEYGNGRIMIGGTGWAPFPTSPHAIGGKNTQCVHVQVKDVSAHYERAKAAGAQIAAEPADQFYGDRLYRVFDLEGHFWTFGQTVRQVSFAEMEAASGHKVTGRE